ncbi:hypothetical protein MMR75_15660, partial [Escherichia coli]|nr:hypothetical protein [Escherichia coli]
MKGKSASTLLLAGIFSCGTCQATGAEVTSESIFNILNSTGAATGFAPIFPDICYHLTHYKPAAADIPVASDNPAHYADAIRYNAR